MQTLGRFEYALGRRVGWSFGGHQLNVAPHAFIDANAFYSKRDQGLFFGYFQSALGKGYVYTCLSHDIIAHETTHALLDGLHERYTDPSSPDQAAFHEGFADVVALLSVFAQPEVIAAQLDGAFESRRTPKRRLIDKSQVTYGGLLKGPIAKLGEQMGSEMAKLRGQALRHSTSLPRNVRILQEPEFQEPHRRGEVLVAAMLDVLCFVWAQRIGSLGEVQPGKVDLERVVEDGARVADHLLTIAIRALDYAPPVDLQFGDYVSALLTADRELFADDSKYQFRRATLECFVRFGIAPASDWNHEGTWELSPHCALRYDCNHFEGLQRDPDEVFRFVWENREQLDVYPDAFCRVLSVRPCVRHGPDGVLLRETVARYIEILNLKASELHLVELFSMRSRSRKTRRLKAPRGLPPDSDVCLYGGGTLVFDDFGRLKFHIKNRIQSPRQQARLEYLVQQGHFSAPNASTFAAMHRRRALSETAAVGKEW